MAIGSQLTRSQRWWGTANGVAAVVFAAVSIVALAAGQAGILTFSWGASLAILCTLGAADYLVWQEEPPAIVRALQVLAFLAFLSLTVARIL